MSIHEPEDKESVVVDPINGPDEPAPSPTLYVKGGYLVFHEDRPLPGVWVATDDPINLNDIR